MTTLVLGRRPEHASAAEPPALPAWPVLALLWGFPVFWLLGVTLLADLALSVVMLCLLARRGVVTLAPGVPLVLAFLVWALVSGLMIDSGGRLLGFAFRMAIFVVAATALVYTLSAPRLTRRRLVDALTVLWVVVIVGGLLSYVAPEARLTTPVGAVLPGALTQNSYVRDLFFPAFAEVQHPWGSPVTFVRPSAPFPYANSWGVAIAVLTPVAAACFAQSRSRAVRAGLVVAALVMLAPAVSSSNRGMFLGLAVAALYCAARFVARDRAAPALALTTAVVAGGALVVGGGFLSQVAVRQEFGNSTGGRLDLYAETWSRVLSSPLLGWGAPRPSQTVEHMSVGTQGFVWLVLFSHGVVGLALVLGFLVGTTLRTWRARGDVDLFLHASLVVTCLLVPVYGLDVTQLLAVFLVAAVLLRRREAGT